MSSTFTCPIRINKYNNPTNDGTIAPDNTGAAVCSQQVVVTTTEDAEIVIPAGSIIHSAQFFTTDTGTSRSIELDGTGVGSVATTAAVNNAAFTSADIANVGTVDVVISALAASDGSAGTFSVMYTPRNANGTITPYGSGYTNN